MESTGVKSPGFMVNMALYIVLVGVFVLAMSVLYALTYVQSIKVKIQKIIQGVMDKTFWNNTIRSVSISYLETAKTFYVQARINIGLNLSFPILRCFPIMAFLLGYPLICAIALIIYRERLDEKSMKDRIYQMYNGIYTSTNHKYSVLFYPIFIFRRFIFVLIPVVISHPAQQIQALTFSNSIYMIAYGTIMPHHDKMVRRFELFNEMMFMVLNYHLYSFSSGYIVDPTKMTQYAMGYSYLGSIGVLVLFNLIYIAIKAVKKGMRAHELKQMKKAH